MVSSPIYNPDFSKNDPARMNDPQLRPQINRAMQENLAPGSIFKTVVAIAALENGLNPNESFEVEADRDKPTHGCIYVGKHKIHDEAPPGIYNFKKAFIHSSNSYFVHYGMDAGPVNIVRVGREFHLGERTGLFAGQETRGNFPTLSAVQDSEWRAGETANLCIGQGDIDVTPVQMAVMVGAIANGGYVLWPRLVQRIQPLEAAAGQVTTNFPAGQIRDRVMIHPRNLNLLRQAMLADVGEKDGTGTQAAVPGLTICGKTGTAQVQDAAGHETGRNLWFASYAPFDRPRYAVVVMVESTTGGFGGTVCAPIAHDIYEAIVKKGTPPSARILAAGIHL
jgi:penicillin-binding protein 2